MKIAVFGATGLTGGLVVTQALEQGHDVVALVRDPSKVARKHPRLVVLGGSPISTGDVERCVRGADVVVHCLGIGGKGDGNRTTLISDSVKAVLAVMGQLGVPRIVCMSNVGAGGSGTWFANRIVIPLFLRWLLPIIEDKDRMEAALGASSVEWGSVRLPNIVEGPEKPLRVSTDGRGIGLSVTASSAARFLLSQATAQNLVRSTPSISN
jgi:uncharacterized protein YbjT (DUF2867 family)